ncbi:NAD(P)/FAD-dependent oxidoreductase [Kamptonema cortianum]|nr:NAD(P)/FAD-dependent oxidoreductase [Oscillatoria laete-virens]MDK3160300.1 NAD(P)/FAD-dependent oxidoreductase [Kamptonema cortianum]MDL5053682.1 NAD(P)/FAD-dependent oxidoreductase [Oscillatoria laete-virens NRMC-F 0139]
MRDVAVENHKSYDVAIIGAGAAGLMCAIEAGKRGRSVLVLEHNQTVGKKILISGGGRCNFTNLNAGPDNYLSENPDFCRSALSRFKPADFIRLVESHGIAYHEKKLGQQFCDGSSREIIDMLEDECRAAGVTIQTGVKVSGVGKPGTFEIQTSRGAICASSVVIACGGLSLPKIGATDFAYAIAAQFAHRLVTPRAGLVPLTFQGKMRAFCSGLSGVSVDVSANCAGKTFRENLLFTHRGLSGPGILQISSFWQPGHELMIDLLPGQNAEDFLEAVKARDIRLDNLLAEKLPARFAAQFALEFGPARPVKQYDSRQRGQIARALNAWTLRPDGSEGYATAEVTVGGVDTRDINQKTFESRKLPGLYFIGECLDVTGWLGGYNFQWAWASGYCAGQAC